MILLCGMLTKRLLVFIFQAGAFETELERRLSPQNHKPDRHVPLPSQLIRDINVQKEGTSAAILCSHFVLPFFYSHEEEGKGPS